MRSYSAVRPKARMFRPSLEMLENRDCPTGMPPSIQGFMVMGSGPHTYTLHGQVNDEQAGNLIVQFTGVFNGSVQTAPDGTFSMTVEPNQLGSIQAKVTDSEGLTSAPAYGQAMSAAPMISNFYGIHQISSCWLFTGNVSDEYAEGLVVRFGGLTALQGQTATVTANGTFSLAVSLGPNDHGTASAQTTDWWGQESNQALCLVY